MATLTPLALGWDKKKWMDEAFTDLLSGKYPRIRGASYWHERWEEKNGAIADLRISSSPSSLAAYRRGTGAKGFVSDPVFVGAPGKRKLVPPATGMYVGAFPDFGGTEDQVTTEKISAFESLSLHKLAWAYFSNNWYDGIQYPAKAIETIGRFGRLPFVRLMMRSRSGTLPDPKYSLQAMVKGEYDKELYKWAREAKAAGRPLVIEFGTEVNGDWFPWSGKWNGGGTKNGFGDPNLADGPERFQHAYRHLVEIFREVQVPDITWVCHFNAVSSPNESWNVLSAYYPGDEYVDWIGVSVYGPQSAQSGTLRTFSAAMSEVYPALAGVSLEKPLLLLEWGIAESAK